MRSMCTPLTAKVCPAHGRCTCPRVAVPGALDVDCPLHALVSDHPRLFCADCGRQPDPAPPRSKFEHRCPCGRVWGVRVPQPADV